MKKLTTVILVLSLVLGGVALAAPADLPQTPKNLDLNTLQKISDQEAQQLRGTGISWSYGPNFGGFGGVCPNPTCPQSLTSATISGIQLQTRDQIRTPGQCK
jgi:hypothetical protein